jgi:hypothetical protein
VGELPSELSIIFLKSCMLVLHVGLGGFAVGRVIFYLLEIYRASWWASYLISFRILGAISESGESLNHSRVRYHSGGSGLEAQIREVA